MGTYDDYFKNKKVTVMGLGLLGRGVGDAAYIAEAGAAEVIVTDLKSEEELKESVEQLQQYENITFVLGEHREEDFKDRDLVLVAAGVPMESPYLEAARAAGVPLKQSAALFAELSKIPIIGVTGTRGKSTVTHIIHHVLSVVTSEPIILGGNIRGVSNLQLLKEVKEDSLAVMELDSWQLQGFGWAGISPQIAVFTNFMEDHLNYYQKGGKDKETALRQYFADKANIFRYQEESGVLVTTPEVFEIAKAVPGLTVGQEVVLVDGSEFPEDAHLSMPGEHNRLNAALATAALKAVSLTEEQIFEALSSFSGVSGRLEYLGDHNGASIYNDNNATTPAAVVKALESLGNTEEKRVVLIAGGAYKDIGPEPLAEAITTYCHSVFLLPGTGTDKLVPLLGEAATAGVHVEQVESLFGAVSSAVSVALPGQVIVFSPGFASFGMFKNEYDRNDQFIEVLREIQK